MSSADDQKPPSPCRVALLQMKSGIDPQQNMETIRQALREARDGGAFMLFTPEMALLLDRDRARSAAHLSREEDCPYLAELQKAARETGLWLHIGSAAFMAEDDPSKRVNRSLVIDNQGRIRARYDKMHLFDVDLSTGESWRESATYVGGSGPVAIKTPWAMVGLSICYDLRFPDLYAALTNAGATLLTIPAAFTVPTGEAHWHILQRARAIEASVFVVAAAQCGTHDDGRTTYGHSLVIDPWGQVLLDMGREPGLGFANIDPSEITRVRNSVPALANRRPVGEVTIF